MSALETAIRSMGEYADMKSRQVGKRLLGIGARARSKVGRSASVTPLRSAGGRV